MVIVGGDRDDLSVRHGDLRVERGEFQMLLVLFRAIVAAREREDQRVVALEFAQFAQRARVDQAVRSRGKCLRARYQSALKSSISLRDPE